MTALGWVAYYGSIVFAAALIIGAIELFAIRGVGQRARTRRWERSHPDPVKLNPEPDRGRYTLADDIDVPLIEVVLDAEARADPDYWKPKPPPPDPYESAHELLNRPTTIIGHGVQFRRGGIIHGPRATRLGPAREPGPW